MEYPSLQSSARDTVDTVDAWPETYLGTSCDLAQAVYSGMCLGFFFFSHLERSEKLWLPNHRPVPAWHSFVAGVVNWDDMIEP